MASGKTSAAVRYSDALGAVAAASAIAMLLLPAPVLAAAPGARTSAMSSLEEALIVTPDLEPSEGNLPVLGYVRRTEDGWRVGVLPGTVPRTGPLPVITSTVSSALEDMTAHSIAPYTPLIRVDF